MIGRLGIVALLAVSLSPASAPSSGAVPPAGASAPNAPDIVDPADPLGGAHPPVALLIDGTSGQQLYSRQADKRFLPASMTKTMTLFVAFELITQGKLALDQRFVVSPATWQAWNGQGSSVFFRSGEAVPLDTLLHAIATASANDAAVVLAEGHAGSVAGWTALMNAEAKALGMKDSHFNTPNGWPDGGATYTSANDLVRLSEALVSRYPALYHRYFGQPKFEWGGGRALNHDPTLGVVTGADGIKTGSTREAGFNFLGSAERDGRRLFMVIGGTQSENERAIASRTLLEWGFSHWRHRSLYAPGSRVGYARVQGGDAREISLHTARGAGMSWPASASDSAAVLRVRYDGPLVAPIRKGDRVAELEIAVPGAEPGRVPLVAGENVGIAGPFDRLVNGLAGLLP